MNLTEREIVEYVELLGRESFRQMAERIWMDGYRTARRDAIEDKNKREKQE